MILNKNLKIFKYISNLKISLWFKKIKLSNLNLNFDFNLNLWFETFFFKENFDFKIIYKIYIYNVISSTVGSTNEPWIDNFSSLMTSSVLKTLY